MDDFTDCGLKMKLQRFDNPSEFYRRVEPFLLAREVEHNVMLGICMTLIQTDLYQQPPYLALVEDDGEVVATALRTPPHNLILSEMADERPLPCLADDVYAVYGTELDGVLGPKPLSRGFADLWTRRTGLPARLKFAERLYRLDKVRPVTGVPGELRRATELDRDLVLQWSVDFNLEALGEADPEQIERFVSLALTADSQSRGRYLWFDGGQPVSMVGYVSPTLNGMRIGPVYTPPELRGRGYGSACTAAVSQLLLDQGRSFVLLYTDLSNPTSNHIYQNIGYEPVRDVDVYEFGK